MIDFPNNPSDGETHAENNGAWVYNNPPGAWQALGGDASIKSGQLISMGALPSTSGSQLDWGGIPQGIDEVIVALNQVGCTTIQPFKVILKRSTGPVQTGYISSSSTSTGSSERTDGMVLSRTVVQDQVTCVMNLWRIDPTGHVWINSHSGLRRDNSAIFGGGRVNLNNPLTGIRIEPVDGTFNFGTANVFYRQK